MEISKVVLAVTVVFLINSVGYAFADSDQPRREVAANEVMDKIKNGLPVEYDNVIIRGDLDLKGLELRTAHVDRTDDELHFGLSRNPKVVSSTICITNSDIIGGLNFDDTIFMDTLRLSSSNISQDAKFSGAYFNRDVFLDHAKIKGYTWFNYAHFRSMNTRFDFAEFDYFDFDHVIVDWAAEFQYARFNGYADFVYTEFRSYASFANSNFYDVASFSDVNITGTANFRDAHFYDLAYFTNASIGLKALFKECVFDRDVSFVVAKFKKDAEFSNATFNGIAYFSSAKFSGNADFTKAKFGDEVDFGSVVFLNYALFSGAQFNKFAGFGECKFHGAVYFEDSRFLDDAFFRTARFMGDLTLYRADYDKLYIRWHDIKSLNFDETTYLELIENFKNLGYYPDADQCYVSYRNQNRPNLPLYYQPIDFLLWILYGYGTMPELPIIWSLLVILLCGGFFYFTADIETPDKKTTLMEAMYLSAAAFTSGARTLGGFVSTPEDVKVKGRARYVLAVEKLLGLLLVGLFLTALARTVIR